MDANIGTRRAGPLNATRCFVVIGDHVDVTLPPNTCLVAMEAPEKGFTPNTELLAQIPYEHGTLTVIALGDYSRALLHDAASELAAVLAALGGTVRFHNEPSGLSLLERLGKLSPEMHASILEAALKNATEKLPKKSTAVARKSEIMPHIDWALARTTIGTDKDCLVLAEFAARRLETTTRYGFAPDGSEISVFHTVEVTFTDPQSQKLVTAVARQIPDEMLATPRALLNRIPGTTGALINPAHGTIAIIEQAIRGARSESVIHNHAFKQIGWRRLADGKWGYLTPDGAVTSNGLDDSHRAMTENKIQYKLSEADVGERPWDFWKSLLDSIAPEVGYPLVGHILAAWAGMQTDVGYGGSLLLHGAPGSGKSTVSSLVGRLINPSTQLGDSMLTFDSSVAAARAGTTGMDSSPVVFDDAREELDLSGKFSKAAEQMRASWEILVRFSYGGAAAAYNKMRPDEAAKGWTNKNSDPSNSVIILVAERAIPGGRSTAERIFPVKIERETVFTDGNMKQFETLVGGTAVNGVLFDFLKWCAGERDARGDGWLKEVRLLASNSLTSHVVDELPPRASEVASFSASGLFLLQAYLESRNGTPMESEPAKTATQKVISKIQTEHWKSMQGDATADWLLIVRILKQAVASGLYKIEAPHLPGYVKRPEDGKYRIIGAKHGNYDLGRVISPKNGEPDYLALPPTRVLEIIRRHNISFHSMTEVGLFEAFTPVGLVQPSNGRAGKMVRWLAGTSPVVALAIPFTVWTDGDDEFEDPEVAA
jgi:energy-coupling factor transporter ATP-binding protein EcfA2